MNTFNKLFSMCAILALGVGCADVSTESLESADRLEAAGHEVTFLDASEESVPEAKPAATCPDGWVDTSIIAIDCINLFTVTVDLHLAGTVVQLKLRHSL